MKFVIFTLFQKNKLAENDARNAVESSGEAADFSRIRCPLCFWQPKASNRWYCVDAGFPEFYFDACGAAWNTFATGGVCPGCRHRWRWTTCLRCCENSRHEDWYAEKNED